MKRLRTTFAPIKAPEAMVRDSRVESGGQPRENTWSSYTFAPRTEPTPCKREQL
jgi:hypothetical protein